MVENGKPAPDFTLVDQQGNSVTLSKLKGSPIVLYFYPKDDTPGCTKEACAFRDAISDYQAAGAKILGVSPDAVASHARFVKKYELPFPLLADTDHSVCELFGVWKEKSMYGKKYMGVERTTFVIDGKGIVRQIFSKVKVEGHASAVLESRASQPLRHGRGEQADQDCRGRRQCDPRSSRFALGRALAGGDAHSQVFAMIA